MIAELRWRTRGPRRERIVRAIVWRLPRSVVYWSFVRLITAGFGGNPAERNVIEAMKSWEGAN